MQGLRRQILAATAVMAMVLAACGDDGETVGTDAGAADTDATTDEADAEPVDGAAEEDEEFDASVDPSRFITSIDFRGNEYDIRDIICDEFDHMFRITGYIDTVHAGGDRIEVVDHEDRDGREVTLTILDEELGEEVRWHADQLDSVEGMTGDDDRSVSGTVPLELQDPMGEFPEHGPEDVTFDLPC